MAVRPAVLLAVPSWFGKIPLYLGLSLLNIVAWWMTAQFANAMTGSGRTPGPWLFSDLSNFGFWLAVYRTPPSRPAMKRPRPESAEARDRSAAPRSDFGNGVLAEAQAEAEHGDFMWGAVRGKIALVISARSLKEQLAHEAAVDEAIENLRGL